MITDIIGHIIYAKRSIDDLQEEDNANNEIQQDIDDINITRGKIKELIDNGVADKVDRGIPVPHKDYKPLDDIKKEYESYFDEESGNNSIAEALTQIDEYLEGEIKSLSESYSSTPSYSDKSQDEPKSKKEKFEDSDEIDRGSSEMPSFLDDTD
jgi:hypothetical protein